VSLSHSIPWKPHIHYENVSYLRKKRETETKISLALIAATLSLGTKYDIKYIREEVVAYVSMEYPSELRVWDERRHDVIDDYDGVQFDLVNLARKHELLVLLPALFLRTLIIYEPEAILQGCRPFDDSLSIMSTEDQNRCILGLHKIYRAQTRYIMQAVGKESPGCDECERCAELKEETQLELLEGPVRLVWADDLDEWDNVPWCTPCSYFFKQEFGRHRKEMWDALPSYFDLPDWSELRCES
jgi:hypothetical protein